MRGGVFAIIPKLLYKTNMLRLIAIALIAAVTFVAVPAEARGKSKGKSAKKVMVHRKAHSRH